MTNYPRQSILTLPYAAAAQIPANPLSVPDPPSTADAATDPVRLTDHGLAHGAAWPAAGTRSAAARLAVDVGADNTTALLEIDQRRIPLLFDGQLALPTPRADVLGRLIDVKGALRPSGDAHHHSSEQAVYQALLQRVVAAADTPIAQLVLTVPPTWGPRRRDLIRQRAADAGLPTPVIVSEAAAAAQATMPHTAEADTVLVCDLGTTGHLTLLRRTDRGWNQLATNSSDTYGGRGLDQAMAHTLSPDDADEPALLTRCASARLDLQTQAAVLDDPGPTAIRIPGHDLAALYHLDDLVQVTTTACEQLVNAARDTLAAADTTPNALSGIVVRGGAAAAIIPGAELRADLGVTPVEPIDPHLLCHGALSLAPAPTAQAVTQPAESAGRRWLKPAHLAAIVLPSILGAHLATQEIDETFTYTDKLRSYRDMYDYEKIQVLFDRPSFAVAGWCLMLSAIAAGTLMTSLLHRHDIEEGIPGRHARLGGQVQIYSVVIGLAIVLMQGVLGYAIIGSPPLDVPRFPVIALTGAVVPAAIVLLVGLLAPLSRRLRIHGWAERLHHPISGPLLAACGSIAGNLYFDTPRVLDWVSLPPGGGQRIRAVLIGVAIVITLVNHRIARAILAIVLALGAFLATGDYYTVFAAGDQLTTAYLAVVAFWWIRQTAHIALDAHPHGLRRMWDSINQQPGPASPPTHEATAGSTPAPTNTPTSPTSAASGLLASGPAGADPAPAGHDTSTTV
ncbi:hypothetical protein HDA40_002126 [Hamadaea flava]|uniref:Hsp70 family protein n=1 Tax=Hamadaea flava TaxID=1742688 RepID=A0ABV8LKZ5_9ACTN|nr:Hsp70 family protein [Hamadaea flava]MCP2323619.1 hypothetical protein [Hamadaea flava]